MLVQAETSRHKLMNIARHSFMDTSYGISYETAGSLHNQHPLGGGNALSLGIQQVKYSIESAAPRTPPPNRIFQSPAHALAAFFIFTPRHFAAVRAFIEGVVGVVVICHDTFCRLQNGSGGNLAGNVSAGL
jgi:hypothetical protein